MSTDNGKITRIQLMTFTWS